MHHKCLKTGILIFSILLGLFFSPVHAVEEPFPLYPVIDPNVTFWTNIYARYSTTQAVVHDSVQLDIIYEVIDLKSAGQSGARKINRQRMKNASSRYTRILKRLAADPLVKDKECRRVVALFGEKADMRVFGRARHRVRCQIGQKDRFRAGLVRSGAYIDQMRSILTSYGVPVDLAYLPHVESSFNTNAYSKFGAAGMWQFTRSTGKRFMTVDYVLDERRDPIAAAHAAARLLKENHNRLGTWPLAITAYNHGAAGMHRAKRAHGDYPEIFTSYKGRTFKFASRNFYSEFLAARRVASDYQRYFGDLALAAPARSRSVTLDGFASLADLCRHFEVSSSVVRKMNPALRPPVLNGQKHVPKGYVLNLPRHAESDDGLLADIPAGILKKTQKPSRYYTVQRGDTAGKIAHLHQVKLSDLILANNLDRRATVYARQTIRIPQQGQSARIKKNIGNPVKKERVAAVTAVSRLDRTFNAPENLPVESAVARYRRPEPAPADLLAMGDPESTQTPADSPARKQAAVAGAITADVGFARMVRNQQQAVGIVQVEVEETLGHFAEWAGVTASRIRRINSLPFGQPLQLHQKIKIPLAAISAEDFEARRYEFHKRLQEDFYAAYRVGELQRYRVQPGDSYWTLCREKFDLPLWLLKHYNSGVNLAALRIHQPLTIPAIERVVEINPDV